MHRVKYFVTDWFAERLLSQWVMCIMIIVHLGLCVAVVVGGAARFTIPSYEPLIEMSFGHTWLWGVWIGLSGWLMMFPYRWPNIVGLWLGMSWMVMWTGAFGYAMLLYPGAAATPVVAYAGFALIDSALLTARVVDKNEG